MKSSLVPYINFKDNTRKAMEYYKSIFGGKIELHTFAEYESAEKPEDAEKIMHSMIEADNGLTFMAADTPSNQKFDEGTRVSLSLAGDNEQELSNYFKKLSEDGKVVVPLVDQVWGDKFGMLIDKFGVKWMVDIGAPRTQTA